jgi:hypothetical protein
MFWAVLWKRFFYCIIKQENRELFRKAYNVLATGGRITVSDFIRGTNPFAAIFGVNMLTNTQNGDTYALEQYIEWLESAGFSNVQFNEVGVRRVITAIKIITDA